jgi:hypothetical protein
MSNKILNLIDDIEILLKQDNRFYLSNDHKFRNKIKDLSKSKNSNIDSIDIIPIINLVKLNQKNEYKNNIQQTKTVHDIESLKLIVARLSMLNDKLGDIIS